MRQSVSVGPAPQEGLNVWDRLSEFSRNEFLRLRSFFHGYHKPYGKDARSEAFFQEIVELIKFCEIEESGREERSRLVGLAVGGPAICINTKVLHYFLGRSKSSINGGLQNFGYLSVRNKVKCREFLLTLLPSLRDDPSFFKLWSVRSVLSSSKFCFLSAFPSQILPSIEDGDLSCDFKSDQPFRSSDVLIIPLPPPPSYHIPQDSFSSAAHEPKSANVGESDAFDFDDWN